MTEYEPDFASAAYYHQPMHAPFVDLQRSYWQPAPVEQSKLFARGIESLDWPQRLRLHHLLCIEQFQESAAASAADGDEIDREVSPSPATDRLLQLAELLLSPASPYRARYTMLWSGAAGESEQREPDLRGVVRNASLTHLGCLEAITLDEQLRPRELKFIPFDDIRGVLLGRPTLFRAAKILYEHGREDEMVCLPLLYGLSWLSGRSSDSDGTVTRFCCHIAGPPQLGQLSIGVGHQDLLVRSLETRGNLVGLGSPGELAMALEVDDPQFDAKCQARGIDPQAIRRQQEENADDGTS